MGLWPCLLQEGKFGPIGDKLALTARRAYTQDLIGTSESDSEMDHSYRTVPCLISSTCQKALKPHYRDLARPSCATCVFFIFITSKQPITALHALHRHRVMHRKRKKASFDGELNNFQRPELNSLVKLVCLDPNSVLFRSLNFFFLYHGTCILLASNATTV